MSQVLALSDGNCFYCSCERVFEPALEGRPVIVLSSNDGNAIARTPEAKALGIKMGDPYFQIRDLCAREGVVVRSSNYALYGLMSRRVNAVYDRFAPAVQVHSIDESFLDLTGMAEPVSEMRRMRETVWRWTGIPTCVGLGPTKTLAKVANHAAKKDPAFGGVCDLTDAALRAAVLSAMAAGEVWGVGPASAAKLARLGVTTAADLRDLDPRQARQALTVVGERIVHELRGAPCLPWEEVPAGRKGCAVTRSFGRPLADRADILEAVAGFAFRVGEKLRRNGVAAPRLAVFMHTNPFATSGTPHSASGSVGLMQPTNDGLELAAAAREVAGRIWRAGPRYTKAGVICEGLVPVAGVQLSALPGRPLEVSERLMGAVDTVNQRFGRGSLFVASAGVRRAAAQKAEWRSPRYLSRIAELPIARA